MWSPGATSLSSTIPSPARLLLTPSPGHGTPLGSALPLAAAFWHITHVFLPKEAPSCRACDAVELPQAQAQQHREPSLPPQPRSCCTPIPTISPVQFQPQSPP